MSWLCLLLVIVVPGRFEKHGARIETTPWWAVLLERYRSKVSVTEVEQGSEAVASPAEVIESKQAA